MSKNENIKEKYNKFISDIRKEKNIANLNLIYEDLKENKDNLFENDSVPFQFSNDLIWLLVNNLIDVNTQMEIFKLYIDSFFLFKCKPEDLNKLRILEGIFNYFSFFYKSTSITNDLFKFMRLYFEKYFPKKEKPKYEIGEIVDVFINERYGNNDYLYGWIYGKVKRIEENFVIIYDSYDSSREVKFHIDAIELQKKNTFTSEEEMNWRNNLKKGMKIDFLNEKKIWIEAEIVEDTKHDSVEFTEIGGNLKYTKHPLSPYIRPLLTFSFAYEENEIRYFPYIQSNEFFNKFNYCFPTPNNSENNKNFLLPVDNLQYYSFLYYDLLNYFLFKLFSENILGDNGKEIAIEYIFKILEVIFGNLRCINQIFYGKYFKDIIFPRIKDTLIKISLNKKKNISKVMVDHLLNISEKMITLNCYSIQEYKIIPIFIISFGFNCFKISENLEKRILGLSTILTTIVALKFYKENEILLIIGSKIYQNLFGEKDEDLLDLLFNKADIHEQLLLKGIEIITNLARLNLLDDKEIIKLYNFTLSYQEGTKIYNTIYSILNNISQEISFKQKEILINKITSFPMEKIRKNDVNLMICIIQYLRSNQDSKSILQKVLDYLYNFINNDISKGKLFLNDFTRVISTFQHDDMMYFYDYFMGKIINELLEQKSGEKIDFFYNFFSCIIISFNVDIREEIKEKVVDLLKNNNNSEKLLKNLMDFLNNDFKKENENEDISCFNSILKSIRTILQFTKYNHFLTIDILIKFCDIFVFVNKKIDGRKEFFSHLLFFCSNDYIDVNTFIEKFFEKFDLFLSSVEENSDLKPEDKLVDENYVDTVFNLYKKVNNITSSNIPINSNEDSETNYNNKINPLDAKYFNIVWKMLIKFYNYNFAGEFLENFSLRLFTPKERYEIWTTIIKKLFDEEEKIKDKKVILNILLLIMYYSEYYGTANVISYSAEKSKQFPLKIKIANKMDSVSVDFDINENIFTTSTIYDVKKEIQKKTGIDPTYIDVNLNDVIYKNKSNGTTLLRLFNLSSNEPPNEKVNGKDKSKFTLIIKRSREIKFQIKKYPLVKKDNENEFTEKTLNLFTKLFNVYTNKTQKMDIIYLKDYLNKATSFREITISDTLLNEIKSFDQQKKGYLTLEEFLNYYMNCIKTNKTYVIYNHLCNLGYRRDLELLTAPLPKDNNLSYQENNIMEYMPRYFIGNNMEYMKKIFNFLQCNDKIVHELASKLIKELCTMSNVKNLLVSKENKIDNILKDNNLELSSYVFDILLSELEKNNESKEEEMNKLIYDFIKNNLCKLINSVEKTINMAEDSNNTYKTIQFLNYYHIIMQIIAFSLKKLIDDLSFIQLVEKFDDLTFVFHSISTINIKPTEKNIEILKNLNLEKTFNIIISNLDFLGKNNHSRDDMRDSFLIIIMILFSLDLIFDENLKESQTKIFIIYINNIMNLSKGSNIVCKRYTYLANKFILNGLKKNKYFSTLIKKTLGEEINNYEALNNLSGINYIFKLYNDIIDIVTEPSETDDDTLYSLAQSIIKILTNENILLKELTLSEYLGLLCGILKKLKNKQYKKIFDYDFTQFLNMLINEFIINKDENENENKRNYSYYNDYSYVENIFELLGIILSLDINKYAKYFFDNEHVKILREKYLSILPKDKTYYKPRNESVSICGFLGLKNLCSLCYMNSVIQQLYMIPIFKNSILSLPIDSSLKEEEDNDNLLFQLEKMFYYLTYSHKSFYNPKSFVYSFKDYDGNPTNPNIQCDAQEFLTRFIDKIEEDIKNKNERFLCNNILGGTTLQKIICTNPDCKNISERKENIIYLSLDLKGNKTIDDCLNKFIEEERIEDYHCEKCDKKITHMKNVVIDKLPNILILYLQRIAFNYETFLMEKINDDISFDKNINVKKYTVDKLNELVNNENYEYELIGIIIHSGTAQYGHYYSVIYNNNDNKWYKFNDTIVTEISYQKFKDEIGTSNIRNNDYNTSPYMLLYQKKIKNPVLLNTRITPEDIMKLIKENKNIEYEIYEDEKDAIEKNMNCKELDKDIILKKYRLTTHITSYENALNYIDKKYQDIPLDHIPFKKMIIDENIRICNDKKIYSLGFIKFIQEISSEIKNIVNSDNTKAKNYFPIIKIINSYIFDIFRISYYKNDLSKIVDNIAEIAGHSQEITQYLIKDIFEPKKEILLKECLLIKDSNLGEPISNYLSKIILISLKNNIEKETSLNIINFYLDKYPVEISKKWTQMEYLNNVFGNLVENSDEIKKIFIEKEVLTKFIDFILGKESPLYKGDDRYDNKGIKGKIDPLIKTIAILYQYYIDNKDTIKLTENDENMLDEIKFYEKIVSEEYEKKWCDALVDIKLKLNFNINEPLNIKNMNLLVILKVPFAKSITEIISFFDVIDSILKTINKSEIKDISTNKKILNILFGIPIVILEEEEPKFVYISGVYYNCFTILTNLAKHKEKNKEIIPLLNKVFTLLTNYEDLYEYLKNLPAPNSFCYSYFEYLIKFYYETKNETEKVEENKIILTELNNVINNLGKKYNIDLEIIYNNNTISTKNVLYFFEMYFNQLHSSSNNTPSLSDTIKIYSFSVTYNLLQKINKGNFPLFSYEYKDFTTIGRFGGEFDENLEKYLFSGVFINCDTDADLLISYEPIFSTQLEISVKRGKHYTLFIKKTDDQSCENDINPENLVITLKENNNNLPQSKPNANEDALVINCPLCGSPNTIDENNQTFQCYFCQAALL